MSLVFVTARPRGGRPDLPARGGDVRRPGGRDRHRPRGLPPAAAPLHAGPAALGARLRRRARVRCESIPGHAARPGRAAAGLPLRTRAARSRRTTASSGDVPAAAARRPAAQTACIHPDACAGRRAPRAAGGRRCLSRCSRCAGSRCTSWCADRLGAGPRPRGAGGAAGGRRRRPASSRRARRSAWSASRAAASRRSAAASSASTSPTAGEIALRRPRRCRRRRERAPAGGASRWSSRTRTPRSTRA